MNRSRQVAIAAAGLILVCGILFCGGWFILRLAPSLNSAGRPAPDFAGTIQALISTQAAATPAASPGVTDTVTAVAASGSNEPSGHIFFTCQLYKYQSSEQICSVAADGSGYHRLTTDDSLNHYYPSPAPDGQSVVYSQYRADNDYEIHELSIADGSARRLTDNLGVLTGPEISPDGKQVIFMRWTVASNEYQVWVMDRDGSHPRRQVAGIGWDPTWAPDGSQILFASDRDGTTQLYAVELNGSGLRRITNLPSIRGRSDWSALGQIATYSGGAWQREVFILNADGSHVRQLSPSGGDSQGPSFSPDGKWVAFTAYFDHPKDINGCEIYIIRTDGTDLRRLTNNDYCDYQPRWGP